MRPIALILATSLLLLSQILCCTITLPEIPEIEINVPTIEVGETQHTQETIPLSAAESAIVEVRFGAGELNVDSSSSDDLFSGHFRYNVAEWEPEVTYKHDVLTIQQGNLDKDWEDWGIPTGNMRNEWDLEFSTEISLEMDFDIGAGDGELNLSGLQLEALQLDMGAGNFDVRFDEPNPVRMSDLTLDTGASKIDVRGIGNASPERLRVQGGVGDIMLDFTGDWSRSSEIRITAGVGSVTLRLPDDVGVRVEVEGGLTAIDDNDLRRRDNYYVNDVFGETEVELEIEITTGIGSISLVEVSND